MCEQDHVAVDLQRLLDHPLSTTTNLLDRLALRDRRRPDRPIRLSNPNLLRRLSFINAIVPFKQVIVHARPVAITGQFASPDGTTERTTEHGCELTTGQKSAQGRSFPLTRRIQRDVGPACMLLGCAPVRLSVADQPQFLCNTLMSQPLSLLYLRLLAQCVLDSAVRCQPHDGNEDIESTSDPRLCKRTWNRCRVRCKRQFALYVSADQHRKS